MLVPRPGQGHLFVPLRSIRSERLGRVGLFFDIPWFGGRDWKSMYDYPAHAEPAQHVPITLAWAVADARKKLAWNSGEADKALRFFVESFGYCEAAKGFLAAPTPPDEFTTRGKVIEAALKELDDLGGLAAYADAKPEELQPADHDFINSYHALRRVRDQNAEIARTLPRKAAELRGKLRDKAVLVGLDRHGRHRQLPHEPAHRLPRRRGARGDRQRAAHRRELANGAVLGERADHARRRAVHDDDRGVAGAVEGAVAHRPARVLVPRVQRRDAVRLRQLARRRRGAGGRGGRGVVGADADALRRRGEGAQPDHAPLRQLRRPQPRAVHRRAPRARVDGRAGGGADRRLHRPRRASRRSRRSCARRPSRSSATT
jgi:hypothetical protein